MATKFLDYTGLSHLWSKFKEWCNSIFVTKATDENITGTKTFVGSKKIAFKQSGTNDKLGFTLFNNSGKEQGYLEYNPTNKIAGVPLMTLGNYATADNELTYVGFRRYSNISGASGAYNLLTPLISDAKSYFNLTTTYTNFYLPLGISDGTNIITADNGGVVNISSLLPSVSIIGWSDITSKPTTISGYGITDAKIDNGTITLGSSTITPLTSHQTLPTLSKIISGSGNAITDITVSGHAITATKDSTFLTSTSTLDATKLSGTIPSDCYTNTTYTAGVGLSLNGTQFSLADHNQASNTITAMTDYSKPSSSSAIVASDSLNAAIGKLEAKVDTIDANHTHNKLLSAGDNVASTSTNTYASGYFNVRWFNQANKVPGQPSQYGFLATFALGDGSSEVHQIWCTQNDGDLYHRGTNGSSYTSPPAFKKIIDSSNETQLSLTTSGSGNAITALSVSNHAITATKGTTFLTSHQDISGKVSKSGDTMTGNLIISNAAALYLKQTNMVRGTAPSANRYPFPIIIQDNNGKTCGGLYYEYATNKQAKIHLMCYQGTTNANTWNSIGVGYDSSGNAYTWAPTPATADNSTKIATTAFVKAQGYAAGNHSHSNYLTSHQSLANYVTLNTSQTITGFKTLNSIKINGVIRGDHTTGTLGIWAGTQDYDGACILLRGRSEDSGKFHIRASTKSSSSSDGSEHHLTGTPDGSIYWNGTAMQLVSDIRLKQDYNRVTESVLNAWEDINWVQYKFKESVLQKGNDARFHIGLIAQHVKEKFLEKNMDICKYGILCHEYNEEIQLSEEVIPKVDEWTIRYTEALCMEAAYQRHKNKILENQISELEKRLAKLEGTM